LFTTGTEMTTAATDLINGVISIGPMLWFLRKNPRTKRNKLWAAAFGMLALMSAAGFLIHGFVMSPSLNDLLWCGMYLFLSLMVSSYVIAIKYDLDGEKGLSAFIRADLLLAVMVPVGLGVLNYLFPDYSFALFSVYCLAHLIYCIVRLWRRVQSCPCFKWYLLSIFILILGSALQAVKSIQFTLIWPFNDNAVYHWMTLLFMLVQFYGARLAEKTVTQRNDT